jgi:thioester reductase-like protein
LNVEDKENYRNVLLLGTTGFLGIHLFHELLYNTGYQLHLLIRGKTVEDAKRRLNDKYRFYFTDNLLEEQMSRVTVHNGDLTMEKFGLDSERYEELAGCIDCIINSAALVKHLGSYQDFSRINVGGTERVIEFALTGKRKDINQISSTGVGVGNIEGHNGCCLPNMTVIWARAAEQLPQVQFECEMKLQEAKEKDLMSIFTDGYLSFQQEQANSRVISKKM